MTSTASTTDRAAVAPRNDHIAIAVLVAGNALTLAIALWQRWPLLLLLWPFWVQSVVIGFFSAWRMILLRRFTYETRKTGAVRIDGNPVLKWLMAVFFVIHYGLFHVGYLVFLGIFTASAMKGEAIGSLHFAPVSGRDLAIAIGTGAVFVVVHAISFRRNRANDASGSPSITTLMTIPYLRVLPMHALIILGALIGDGPWALIAFATLKTIADVKMQAYERRSLTTSSTATAVETPPTR